MKWTIDSDIVSKHNLTMDEFIYLVFLARGGDVMEYTSSLMKRGWIDKNIFKPEQIILTLKTKEIIQEILLDSDKQVKGNQDKFISIANKLRELFPKGNKAGTNYSWRGSTAEIAKKLKNLVVKYKCNFTEDEAVEATKAYIDSFNGNYKYMKLLKYFLLKTPVNNNGDVEVESEFMTYLENKGEMGEYNNPNWTTDLA